MKKNRHQSIFALLAAIIWGAAFSAQSVCAQYLGPLTITALRSLIAFLVLFAVCLLRRKSDRGTRRDIIIGSIVCGAALFAASNMQQLALNMGASAGKAGFITALYIVLVPIGQVFFKQKISPRHWLAVAVAVVGMYFLCITEGFSVNIGDWLTLIGSLCFAVHILVIDHFAQKTDGVKMSCIQFFTCAVICAIAMAIFETPTFSSIAQAWLPICYAGVMSCGVAYTLQIVGQKNMEPTVASLILSLESVVGAIAGWLLLGQALTGREIFGCALVFCGIILAQLPADIFMKRRIVK